jgi:hypothetical protein
MRPMLASVARKTVSRSSVPPFAAECVGVARSAYRTVPSISTAALRNRHAADFGFADGGAAHNAGQRLYEQALEQLVRSLLWPAC